MDNNRIGKQTRFFLIQAPPRFLNFGTEITPKRRKKKHPTLAQNLLLACSIIELHPLPMQ